MNRRDRRPMSPRARSAFRTLTVGATSLATLGAFVATGWYTALAANDYQHDQAATARTTAKAKADRAAWFAAHPVVHTIYKHRKHVTVVRTVHVPASAVRPGPGGSLSHAAPAHYASSPQSSGSGGSSGNGGGNTTNSHPAPPPPPPPAPSSGS